jgi:hypothetical protein
MSTTKLIKQLAQVDILKEGKVEDNFIGRPFYLDYDKSFILINDFWKNKVNGIPQGTFLLAFYDNEESVSEAILLRALRPTKLPTDNDVISSMVEYYKDNLNTSGKGNQLDQFTKYEFSFSGLECRVLGTFYKLNGNIEFGADLENFYSANNYRVFKASDQVLMQIVNQRDKDIIAGNENEFEIGFVRYSSSRRFHQENGEKVKAFINPKDFLGKRTALFGMTRTGKSNSVKKIIEATVEISKKAKEKLPASPIDIKTASKNLDPFQETGAPKYSVGQIIFDINGEYANPNMQDEGTAIYELYDKDVIRYSVLEKPGFKVLKVNFYEDYLSGFELVKSFLSETSGDYISSFTAADLTPPEDPNDVSAKTRWERKRAAYLATLYNANFKAPDGFKVKFSGNKELNKLVRPDGTLDPSKGISLQEAVAWFEKIWDNYHTHTYFQNYPSSHDGREWADEDLKAILAFLTRKKTPGGAANVSGFRKLRGILDLHTSSTDKPFEEEIIESLRNGKIIIVDLSQGDPNVQALYSERICHKIFSDSMNRFVKNIPNNFVQFYFEEAHNLFPKKDDSDLSQIYNRIAKEGAKLNLGLIYATQEVSSISSNILKNTQNWFIAHLNNEDEIKELRKYYDFSDFADSLIRFSAQNDKGFVRMKTYSNPFVVPVQINRFLAKKES